MQRVNVRKFAGAVLDAEDLKRSRTAGEADTTVRIQINNDVETIEARIIATQVICAGDSSKFGPNLGNAVHNCRQRPRLFLYCI